MVSQRLMVNTSNSSRIFLTIRFGLGLGFGFRDWDFLLLINDRTNTATLDLQYRKSGTVGVFNYAQELKVGLLQRCFRCVNQ
jgi:hypothetical protein